MERLLATTSFVLSQGSHQYLIISSPVIWINSERQAAEGFQSSYTGCRQ